jgi:pyridoxal phosphate enzyme (YggS family)
MNDRAKIIQENWNLIVDKVSVACRASGRSPDEVTIVGVSKRKPASDMEAAYHAGCRIFGENYVQEAEKKMKELQATGIIPEIHLIGALQKNKVRKAISFSSMIQSVDSVGLAREIDKEANRVIAGTTDRQTEGEISGGRQAEPVFSVLLQVNISVEAQKNGVVPDKLTELYNKICSFSRIRVQGLMAIGSEDADMESRQSEFIKLRELRDSLEVLSGDRLPCLSMGMSSDFELAVKEGASMIRVGSVLFGER